MNSIKFSEAMSELNSKYVVETINYKKKAQKPAWIKWGAMAACLTLICVAAISLLPHNGEDIITTPGVADAAPMVYVNDTLYQQNTEQISYGELKEEFIYLGNIESTDCEAGVPKENFQANHPIAGCEVYQYGEDIVVHINGAYWLYTKYSEPETNWDDLTEQEKMNLDPAYKG